MAERAGEDALRLSKRPEPGSLVESQGAIMGVTRLDIANCVEPGLRVAPRRHAEPRPSATPRWWFTRRSGAQQCHELVERDQIIGVPTLLKRPIVGVETHGSGPPRNRTARRKAMGLRNAHTVQEQVYAVASAD